jgi:hypothetical protein
MIPIKDPLPIESSLYKKITTVAQKHFEDIKIEPMLNESESRILENESESRILESSMVQRLINDEDLEDNRESIVKGLKR